MTAWTDALDTFEANLARLEEALVEHVAWQDIDLTETLPAFEGDPTAEEQERFLALQKRAQITMALVQEKMQAVRDEQLAGDKKVAAARTYGRQAPRATD